MYLVYYSNAMIPSHSANSVHIMKMCQAFSALGMDVELIAVSCDNRFINDVYSYYGIKNHFKITRLPLHKIRGAGILYGFQAARHICKEKPDIAYGRSIPIAYFLSKMNCIDFALELHQPIEDIRGKMYFQSIIKSKHLKRLIVISETLKKYYESVWDISSEMLVVAHDGADIVKSVYSNSQLRASREGQINIGYIGSLHKGKGMEMIAQLVPLYPNCDFHIVGGDDEEVRKWKAALANEQNIFFYGHVLHGDTISYGNGFDLALAPYMTKVFGVEDGRGSRGGNGNLAKWMSPLKLFEYMSMGKVIITSDLPSIREIIIDGKNGFLCRPDDVMSWKDKIDACISDLQSVKRGVGAFAKIEFETRYTWKKRAEWILSQLITKSKDAELSKSL